MSIKSPSTSNELLIELLEYIEQVEKLKKKAEYAVPTDPFASEQFQLLNLPAIHFDVTDGVDEIWLRVERLKEELPPPAAEPLTPWVVLASSPDKVPTLRTEIRRVTKPIEKGEKPVEEVIALSEVPEIPEAFEEYLNGPWKQWSDTERPRRKSIDIYKRLFQLQQSLTSEGSEAPLELVWGLGHSTWRTPESSLAIRHPLITRLCDLSLNEKTFALEVRPRDAEPRLEIDCYAELEVPGVTQLESYWRNTATDTKLGVSPFKANTYENILKAAVGYLDSAGKYVTPENQQVPMPGETLSVTDTWVLYARKRSSHYVVQDVQRLKKKLEEKAELPAVLEGFVTRGSSEVKPEEPVAFRGLSSSAVVSGVRELYFPMPYNEEQVAIVERLERNDGVVVQGPPGTGKTHTIANIVCHYLAQGKRVLVTSNGESALAVLQEKIPEAIRPLCVALLQTEREGMKQMESSLARISAEVSTIQPIRLGAQIVESEQRLDELHAKLAAIDSRVSAFAEKHMKKYPFQERELSAAELAQHVMEKENEYGWLTDKLLSTKNDPTFGASEIAALRSARVTVGADLTYLSCQLPDTQLFPDAQSIATLHRDLVQAKQFAAQVSSGNTLALIDATPETFKRADALVPFLTEVGELAARITEANHSWYATLEKAYASKEADPTLEQLQSLLGEIASLETARKEMLANPVSLGEGAENHEGFDEALERLLQGKKAFGLFGKKEGRALIEAVLVAGDKPTTVEHWKAVHRLCEHRKAVRKLILRWNALVGEFGLPEVEGYDALRTLVGVQRQVEEVRCFVQDYVRHFNARVQEVFGRKVTAHPQDPQSLLYLQASLSEHLDKGRLAHAVNQVSALLSKLEGTSGAVVEDMREFLCDELGDEEFSAEDNAVAWSELLVELRRVNALQAPLADITCVSDAIAQSGAKEWANRLRTEAVARDVDTLAPNDWLEAWNWRCAKTFLDSIDVHKVLKDLQTQRKETEADLSRTYSELIANKAWLGVHQNSSPLVRQGLEKYLLAIQALGKGTGVKVARNMGAAREALSVAHVAVPCWIMSQWKVSEQIPSELGVFDLVIVDEASQSDIWAFPSLLRGKKILVVGDHKQVSPSAVGVAESKIVDLQNRFLANQPHRFEMALDKSIYDLASVVFAGNSIMLREHFRSVPAIIEFSKREFYQNELIPLRVPKRSERLDPPLVDVHVLGGFRKGDTNPPEAEAIVSEIEGILEDPALEGRSLGVVTLQGNEQAALIHTMVHNRISFNDIVERKILVGSPTVFQGAERDIMLVSMVADNGRATSSKKEFEQRFNVAASRARDRMMLFRSISAEDIKGNDLKSRLINHFHQPFGQDPEQVRDLRGLCESGFERDMYDVLVGKGYRVTPQLKVGAYRIDFVVEGDEDRRLAIECDGDRFHGPDQWLADMTRQRVLERAGWNFWRCFASSFVLRREEVLADLFGTLARMGIEPMVDSEVDSTIWVEHYVLDPFNTQPDFEEDEYSEEASDDAVEEVLEVVQA
ncbi:AAA domain-containing protein [Candidimonas sp. SYP-B2681]|uniref:AAA domain-containing protein n=1 Tax=Candidimonas sp. SYP-B2681 TaxID=2497686 RepID=UPI0013157578|nr:AAA domain-containing protein [Candidimonas sp. SYP-B2681]